MMRRYNPYPKDILTKPRSSKQRKYLKRKMFLERALGVFSKETLCEIATQHTNVVCVGNENKRQLIAYIISSRDNVTKAKTFLRTLLIASSEEEFDKIYSSFGLTPRANRARAALYLIEALRINLSDSLRDLKKFITEAESDYRTTLAEQKRQIIADARAVRSEKAQERHQEREAHTTQVQRVVNYLVAIVKYRLETGKKLSRSAYCKSLGLNYAKFSKLVAEYKDEAKPLADKEIASLEGAQSVLQQVMNYLLANHEHKLRTKRKLTAQNYVAQHPELNLASFYRDIRTHKEQALSLISAQLNEITATVDAERAAEKSQRSLRRRSSTKQQHTKTVANYLVAKHVYEVESGKRYTLKRYLEEHNIRTNYSAFASFVRKLTERARPLAADRIKSWNKEKEIEVFRHHVVEYMAKSLLADHTGRPALTIRSYADEFGLESDLLHYYHKKWRLKLKNDSVTRFRLLEAERLRKLREVPKHDPLARLFEPRSKESGSSNSLLKQLRKIAQKPLPKKRGRGGGHVVFSKDPAENDKKMEMWLEIANDVMEIGLSDLVADHWTEELGVPIKLEPRDRRNLILLRIETVLRQLNLFEPPEENITFSMLGSWKRSKEGEPIDELVLPSMVEPIPEIETIPYVEDDEDEEAWLERELQREEEEALRYLDSPTERTRRRESGFTLDNNGLTRKDREKLKYSGAIFDGEIWLLPTEQDNETWNSRKLDTPALRGWPHKRKPRLLVGIGTTDYTKPWMGKAFDLTTVAHSQHSSKELDYRSKIASIKPDALMIYKSSAGRVLYSNFKDAALWSGLPLIVFEKGFSDAVQSAEIQGLNWFVDAYNKRKSSSRMKRFNPLRSAQRHWNRRHYY